MNLGEKIHQLRTKSNLSQVELANALEVSRQSISKWETNASVPELDKLIKMCEVFGVSLDELAREADPAEPTQSTPTAPAPSRAMPAGKWVGIILLSIGLILFFIFSLLVGALGALFFTLPFFVCGAICLFVRRHTALWCGWALYSMIYAYLRYATGIRMRWIFMSGLYRGGMEIHALIAWGMVLGLLLLVFFTLRAVLKWRKKQK